MVRFTTFLTLLISLFAVSTFAQDTTKSVLSIGSGGIQIGKKAPSQTNRRARIHWLMVDVGFNAIKEKSNFSSPEAKSFLQVPPDQQNHNLFSLRSGKSINVNIWPVLLNAYVYKSAHQKISIYTGVGFQFYNFKFNKNITFLNETNPVIVRDSVNFKKNKLAFTNIAVPAMLNFKTRMWNTNLWLTYGVGIIGKYSLDTWTKQISEERGKVKLHDSFNFTHFGLDLSAEFGLNGFIRIFGTYQLTNMYKNALDQHPYSIGIRFLGI